MTSALDMTIEKLEELIHLSLKFKTHKFLQGSLMETVVNIAWYYTYDLENISRRLSQYLQFRVLFSFPLQRVLSKSIRLLLLFVNQVNVPLTSVFYEIAAAHRTTQLLLYYNYRPEISHVS